MCPSTWQRVRSLGLPPLRVRARRRFSIVCRGGGLPLQERFIWPAGSWCFAAHIAPFVPGWCWFPPTGCLLFYRSGRCPRMCPFRCLTE